MPDMPERASLEIQPINSLHATYSSEHLVGQILGWFLVGILQAKLNLGVSNEAPLESPS